MIEGFFDKATEGARIDDTWKRQMFDANTPELPEEPTPEQVDAWNEIAAMVTDESFIAEMRADMASMWTNEFDPAAYAQASNAIMAKVQAAIGKGEKPTSEVGRAIARDWLENSANAMRREPDEAFLRGHLDQYRKHHSRSARYQELLAILRGGNTQKAHGAEWLWINEAMGALLARAQTDTLGIFLFGRAMAGGGDVVFFGIVIPSWTGQSDMLASITPRAARRPSRHEPAARTDYVLAALWHQFLHGDGTFRRIVKAREKPNAHRTRISVRPGRHPRRQRLSACSCLEGSA